MIENNQIKKLAINGAVFEEGMSDFKEGKVSSLSLVEEKKYKILTAYVQDQNTYRVQITLNALEDKIAKNEELDIKDYIQLYAGATVSRNIIQKNINTWSAVVKEYDENLIPKLKEIAKEMDNNKRQALIDDFFGAE